MKTLTISQPYASMIADGGKWIENRTWSTNYRGELAIHAGKGTQYLDRRELAVFPTGCIIAIATLANCVSMEEINQRMLALDCGFVPGTTRMWSDILNHAHAEGPWCWILEDVRAIEHVPIRGAQGLWDIRLEDEILTPATEVQR